jgi:regulatory protein
VSTKPLTQKQALIKAASYCAYQERCHAEVEAKLAEWGFLGIDAQQVIIHLIEQNYLNEERFAKAYAGGKFRVKGWGRQKIIRELKVRKISPYCIQQALQEIDEAEYESRLMEIMSDKWLDLRKERSKLIRQQKVIRFAQSKGYEMDLIIPFIKKIEP